MYMIPEKTEINQDIEDMLSLLHEHYQSVANVISYLSFSSKHPIIAIFSRFFIKHILRLENLSTITNTMIEKCNTYLESVDSNDHLAITLKEFWLKIKDEPETFILQEDKLREILEKRRNPGGSGPKCRATGVSERSRFENKNADP
jgi:hypothetical protein